MKQFLRSKAPYLIAIGLIGLIVAAIWGLAVVWPVIVTFSDSDKLQAVIDKADGWGPLILIAAQILQVVIAPIPGQATGFVGGYLYGPFWGTVYALVGATLGFLIILLLTRKLGRPFVERFIKPENVAKFDNIAKRAGSLTIFLIFLLPFFPDDIVAFIVGLSRLSVRRLLIVSIAGRLPGYAMLSVAGHGFTLENFGTLAVLVVGVIVISALAFWQRNRLREFVYEPHRWLYVKRLWRYHWRQVTAWTIGLVAAGLIAYEIGSNL